MIRYLVASLLLFGFPVSPSWGEDCVKLVANKYCLGGSFSDLSGASKAKEKFLEGDNKHICPDCVYFGFLDDDALGLEKPLIIIDGRQGRIFSVRVCPNPDAIREDFDGYKGQIKYLTQSLFAKYGEPQISNKKEGKYAWDKKSYLVNYAYTPIGMCVAYTDSAFIVKNKDILLNPEGF